MKTLLLVNKSIFWDLNSLKYCINVFNEVTKSQEGLKLIELYRECIKPMIGSRKILEHIKAKSKFKKSFYQFIDSEDARYYESLDIFWNSQTFVLNRDNIRSLLMKNKQEEDVIDIKIVDTSKTVSKTLNLVYEISHELQIQVDITSIVHLNPLHNLSEENSELSAYFKNFEDSNIRNFLEIQDNDIPITEKRYFVQSKHHNLELPYWDRVKVFNEAVYLEPRKVVKGKMEGNKIGIPTANLEYDNKILKKYGLIPGVYFGKCRFESTTKYGTNWKPMVASIGLNPQYDENEIKYEFMILGQVFTDKFYGEKLSVMLMGLIRPQARFSEFWEFIEAMENDINITNNILASLSPSF